MPATVQELIDLFDGMVGEKRNAFQESVKIALLSGGAQAVWQVLVGWEPQQNWFVKRSQSVTPGQDDYFPPLITATREYALPPEFHQLRALEPSGAGDSTSFVKGSIDDQGFLDMRREASTGNSAGVLTYDIEGSNPGMFILDTWPPVAMTVTLAYIAKPTAWALATDSTAEFPTAVHQMIVDWAVQRALLSARQGAWQAYNTQWNADVQRWAATMRRDNTGESVVRGFSE